MTGWFSEICNHSKEFKGATVNCWWSSNALLLEDDELLVYFLPSGKHSLIRRVAGQVPLNTGAGATFKTTMGMISEVYIAKAAGDARIAKLLAVLAFHELMHNKLGSGNHMHGQGGLAAAVVSGSTTLNPGNISAMAQHLGDKRKQWTGGFSHYHDPLR